MKIQTINELFFLFPFENDIFELRRKLIIKIEDLYYVNRSLYCSCSSYKLSRQPLCIKEIVRDPDSNKILSYKVGKNWDIMNRENNWNWIPYEYYQFICENFQKVKRLRNWYDIAQDAHEYGINDYELEFCIESVYKKKKIVPPNIRIDRVNF